MYSSNMQTRSSRHITSDCLARPQLNPQLLEMIDNIQQRIQNNQIELAPSDMNYEIVRQFTFATYPRNEKPDILRFVIAGFYYAGYEDEVTCYCCNLTESGWTENDSPAAVHLKKSPHCAFYVRNPEVNFPFFDLMGHERSLNNERAETLQLPIQNASDELQAHSVTRVERMYSSNMQTRSSRHITSDCLARPQLNPQLLEMIDNIQQRRQNNQIKLAPSDMTYEIVRQFTFATYPRNGKPDIRRFVIAGFYYAGYEDEVTCYCCNLTESGWNVNDIPTAVHLNKSPQCPFYLRNPEVNFPFFDLMGHERSINNEHA